MDYYFRFYIGVSKSFFDVSYIGTNIVFIIAAVTLTKTPNSRIPDKDREGIVYASSTFILFIFEFIDDIITRI